MELIAPPQYTPAQHALFRMQNLRSNALRQLADATKMAFTEFWQNPAATPGEMADALSTNAKAVFDDHAATVAYLLARDPSLLAPADYTPPHAYTFNQDGSMNLSS